ncbi:glycoside hydrolase family 28 protein [Colwellia sp. MB02u-18]|uniref:glycoside hydrolase family 28 protein n=1 Tax=unclassified Colwellia TaxID=196834 RepID=UPI0015F48B61|nr:MULTISPECIES: glycoside hydrolase family 28 protein [unclassified Colwellia]MBA6222651.1 glycoside hydrolase family 28 protein [Colwellia sp. MB3u-45]MBA6269161.1 glycoside hydrolase family 28 protein [Colwellia sp. MB3u-43]MBA6322784.1 glycoside hydrolase family 28 protein [Colwellia sp. MB02u-19]MBA6323443.1 glycoside hydrolase family 28 protein [Colwellia sp. MB02u-18]MBA6332927.1 glycoside hydrolase family 28 protein [Colwellia sp. MB02u-12]
MNQNRRLILKTLASSSVLAGITACQYKSDPAELLSNKNAPSDDWLQAQKIRDAIVVPHFPDKTFNIKNFGAINNDAFDCSSAINEAIKACNKAGGGKVLIPAGIYKTGAIHLLSNVNLHIEEQATLSFITDPKHYLPAVLTRWEGLELMGYSPLIYAYKQENIAITGKGTLEGNANNQTWWPWKGKHKEAHWDIIPGEDQRIARNKLMADAEAGVAVDQRQYHEGAFLRPPFIQPYACNNVLIQDITIKNSPFWLLNPVLCKHVSVKGVSFLSHGPNSDGCDPESCDHVLIEHCDFDTGDDCIAIKSGRNADGRRLATPCQNIVIANCTMREGHGGVVIGSEISGGVNNIFAEKCTMSSPHLERAIRIKTNSVRGGIIEHIRIRDITVGEVKNAIVINFFYEEGDAGNFDPIVRDIKIQNFHCKKVLGKAFNLQGFDRDPIQDFHIENSHFSNVAQASVIKNVNGFTLRKVSINGYAVTAADLLKNS